MRFCELVLGQTRDQDVPCGAGSGHNGRYDDWISDGLGRTDLFRCAAEKSRFSGFQPEHAATVAHPGHDHRVDAILWP